MKRTLFLTGLLAVLTVPSHAFAQALIELTTGETFESSSLSTADTFFAIAEADRSYCCQIRHSTANNVTPFFDSIAVNAGELLNTADRGRNAPWLGAGNNLAASRKCFRYATAGRSFVTLGIDSNTNPILNARVSCVDTTLYGGFNTAVTDFNFIEITNTLAVTDIDGTVTANVKASGTAGTTLLNQTITIAAGKRVDVDVHAVAANDFGPVTITHNGPPGALRAVNVQYRIVTTNPLDFTPVLSVPFREGNPIP